MRAIFRYRGSIMDKTRNNLVQISIHPKSRKDRESLELTIKSLADVDPSSSASIDLETGEVILRGASDVDLDIKVDILKRTYEIDADVGVPEVIYRETIARTSEIDYTHKKHTGGTGEFARVKVVAMPNEGGKGFEFEPRIVGSAVLKEYIPGIEKGLRSALDSGLVADIPDIKVLLVDGAFHDIDSSALAFEIASRAALREALRMGGSVKLEPIMKVEIVTPSDCAGLVVGDLKSHRGKIQGQDGRDDAVVINAMVPLANMFSYASELQSLSQGRANHTMQLDHYEQFPPQNPDPPFRPAIRLASG
ncbi:hypothetical protein HFO12_08395 [Rhizobium leguminosarum]|nr:hypothetical protein [Rhizobium leguminosarum]